MTYTLHRLNDVVLRIEARARLDWQQWFLAASDVHLDNPHCDRGLLRAHLDEAVQRDGGILLLGDTLDLMQGRDDPRRDGGSMKPQYLLDYVDSVLEDAAKFFSPYRDRIVMISEGNHESAVRKRLGTNPTKRLADALGVQCMPYSGWLMFRLTRDEGRRGTHNTIRCYYHHGSGGGGPVTRGVIQTNRRAAMVDGAHILLSGHIHESWTVWTPRAAVNSQGTPHIIDQLHVSTGTYKNEYQGGEGYHVEKERPPKALGGTWVRLWFDGRAHGSIRYEATRA